MKRLTLLILLTMVLNGCAMIREIGVYRDQKAAEEEEYKQQIIDAQNSNNTDSSENTEYLETTPDLEDIENLEGEEGSADLESL